MDKGQGGEVSGAKHSLFDFIKKSQRKKTATEELIFKKCLSNLPLYGMLSLFEMAGIFQPLLNKIVSDSLHHHKLTIFVFFSAPFHSSRKHQQWNDKKFVI